ncbi:hypothetical protein B0T10DRAFT_496553 [Thelonectria olida]|uniref:F-box domain-containing protein n=1 Tax=Thelonectria olida TaxID=1576542 RepID=A0A9P9AKM8_9HYPO|nr:hypothetical protein B0T10DRAFT_496553 [Thelonectria olida]
MTMDTTRTHLPHQHGAHATILSLPDELLFPILKLSVSSSKHGYWPMETYDTVSLLSLAIACKRFHSMMIPLLYHTLFLDSSVWNLKSSLSSWRIRAIYQNIQKDPSLGYHCAKLRINISDFPHSPRISSADFAFGEGMVERLVNVKDLSLSGGFSLNRRYGSWKVLQHALLHMPTLERLSLVPYHVHGLQVQRLMSYVRAPSLKKLLVRKLSDCHPVGDNLEYIVPASFSELSIHDHKESIEAVASLLDWPLKLTSVSLIFEHRYKHYVDLPKCRSMLLKHRETLASLELLRLSLSARGTPCNLSDFSALKSLSLSSCMMAEDLEPEDGFSEMIISIPKIATFTWNLTKSDRSRDFGERDFGEIEERWLRRLAKLALAKKSKLCKIYIDYSVRELWDKDVEYPWDRMSRLKAEFEPSGIEITWSKSRVSRQTWKEWIESSDEGRLFWV